MEVIHLKKQLILLTSLIAGLTGLTLATSPQSVKAAGVYHTIKSKTANNTAFHWNGNQKAYLWNYNLTQKKHHLTNYPKTTWYTSKVLKMTNGTKTGIFYYVSNESGSVKGYAWKGYLTKGTYSSNPTSTSSNTSKSASTKWITKDNPSGIPNPTKAELNALKNTVTDESYYTIIYYQDFPIIKAFPNTTYNHKLDNAAEGELLNNFGSVVKREWGDKLKDIQYLKLSTQLTNQQMQNLANGSPTFKQFVLNDLTKQHVNLSDYKGWQIGMFSRPIYQRELLSSDGDPYIGQYVIALYNPNKQ